MQDKDKVEEKQHGPLWEKLRQEAKDDPELLRRLEAMERVMAENREVLRRLAQS